MDSCVRPALAYFIVRFLKGPQVDAGQQRWTTELRRVKPSAQGFDKSIEAPSAFLGLAQFVAQLPGRESGAWGLCLPPYILLERDAQHEAEGMDADLLIDRAADRLQHSARDKTEIVQ